MDRTSGLSLLTRDPVSAYAETRRRCMAYLGRLLRDWQRSEDVLHDSWLRALEGSKESPSGELESPDEFWVHTFRLAHRVKRRVAKEARVALLREPSDAPAASSSPLIEIRGETYRSSELVDLLEEELTRLSDADRSLLVRHYKERCSSRMLAEEAGVSRQALLSRIRRSRERLRRAMERRLDEQPRGEGPPPRLNSQRPVVRADGPRVSQGKE